MEQHREEVRAAWEEIERLQRETDEAKEEAAKARRGAQENEEELKVMRGLVGFNVGLRLPGGLGFKACRALGRKQPS